MVEVSRERISSDCSAAISISEFLKTPGGKPPFLYQSVPYRWASMPDSTVIANARSGLIALGPPGDG